MKDKLLEAPFAVLRGSGVTLVEQVANGLRRCMATGFYKSGDVLPTTRDLAVQLGVSRRITREAIDVLVREELVSARPGVGCVVLDRSQRNWRGSVLLVSRGDWGSYYVQKFSETFTATLLKTGYLVSRLTVPHDGASYDCSGLDAVLASLHDLVFQIFDCKEIEARLAANACRYVVLGDPGAPRLPARSGTALFSKREAAKTLVSEFVRSGVKDVLVAGIFFYREFKSALARAGIRVVWIPLPCIPGYGSPEGVQRAALLRFAAWFRETPRTDYPDAILFTDDYTAAGALTSLDLARLSVPKDVRVVTMSNSGLGPVWHKDLARFEVSPQADGHKAAEYVDRMLSGEPVEPVFLVEPTFIAGETLG